MLRYAQSIMIVPRNNLMKQRTSLSLGEHPSPSKVKKNQLSRKYELMKGKDKNYIGCKKLYDLAVNYAQFRVHNYLTKLQKINNSVQSNKISQLQKKKIIQSVKNNNDLAFCNYDLKKSNPYFYTVVMRQFHSGQIGFYISGNYIFMQSKFAHSIGELKGLLSLTLSIKDGLYNDTHFSALASSINSLTSLQNLVIICSKDTKTDDPDNWTNSLKIKPTIRRER